MKDNKKEIETLREVDETLNQLTGKHPIQFSILPFTLGEHNIFALIKADEDYIYCNIKFLKSVN